MFFATQALTVMHWSRISDRIGRKPVILVGLFGLSLSMYSFGLSRSFPALVISRCLNGALNGNIGVIKSMIGELTDSTNIARTLSYQPIAWSSGSTIGPLIGALLHSLCPKYPAHVCVFKGVHSHIPQSASRMSLVAMTSSKHTHTSFHVQYPRRSVSSHGLSLSLFSRKQIQQDSRSPLPSAVYYRADPLRIEKEKMTPM